jgi:hypothetical protein
MRQATKLGFFLVSLGVASAAACGDSEKKKSASGDNGGSMTAGSTGAGSGGASGNAAGSSGSGGAAGTNAAGNAGGGVAGSAGKATGGSAGDSGEGGAGGDGDGAGGEDPGPEMKATKLDVLFVIDNSISMYEKQQALVQAVPTLVGRLVDPYCIYSDSTTVPATNGTCPGNSVREIAPVRDMHVGVITSSLGHRGGDVCVVDPNEMPPRQVDDKAHLIGTVRTGLASWNGSGFLKWDAAGQAMPPGESNAAALTNALQAMIAAAGDRGCGYEAPLEAMHRFLVDPEPPESVSNDGAFTVLTGVDTTLLAQRSAFLRPDSALIVILLSDEDDCSIVTEPTQQGWLVGRRTPMPRASSECKDPLSPNYACCRHCLTDVPNCPPNAGDAECVKGAYLTSAEDSTNLRCYRQTERFGVNLLYPVERYVSALTSAMVANRSGQLVQNPLFTGSRTPQHVVFTTIVGVPWQDLVKETENFDGYELMTAYELRVDGRFPIILGDYARGVPPTDPFMIDSIDPRSGRNPLTNQPIAPYTAANDSTINGHEQNVVNRDDLQYACTFRLPAPIPCSTANQDGCDCNASEQAYSRPLCEYPGAAMDGTQVYGKAYPGRRELEVARRLRDQAVLASICPRTLEDPMHPSYGYVPAMRALQRQVRRVLIP